MPFSSEDIDRAVKVLERLARTGNEGPIESGEEKVFKESEVTVFKEALQAMKSPLFSHLVDIQQQLGETINAAKEWNEAVCVDTSLDADTERDFQERYGLVPSENGETLPTSGLERIGVSHEVRSRRWSDDWPGTETFTCDPPRQPLASLSSSLEGSEVGSVNRSHPRASLTKRFLEHQLDSFQLQRTASRGSESPPHLASTITDNIQQQAEREQYRKRQRIGSRQETSAESPGFGDDVFAMSAPALERQFPSQNDRNRRIVSASEAFSKPKTRPVVRGSSTGSQKAGEGYTSCPLKDSLFFLRDKESLSRVLKASSNRQERHVSLTVEPDGLGMFLVGSVQHGIFIDSVVPQSNAETAGCRHGDQLLAINEHSFEHRSLEEVVSFVKTVPVGEHMQLLLCTNMAGLSVYKRDANINR